MYGKSVKHQPQRVGLSHELADEDIGMCLSLSAFYTLFVVQLLTVFLLVTIVKR